MAVEARQLTPRPECASELYRPSERRLLAKLVPNFARATWSAWRMAVEVRKLTSRPECASELYRPSERRLSAKLVPTLADIGCHVVSVTDPYGRILCFLDRKTINFEVSFCTGITLPDSFWVKGIVWRAMLSPSRETVIFWATHELANIISPPLVPFMTQINSDQDIPFYVSKIHLNVILLRILHPVACIIRFIKHRLRNNSIHFFYCLLFSRPLRVSVDSPSSGGIYNCFWNC
jgi:hypothetical protein